MIELRWLMVHVTHEGVTGLGRQETEKRLQYRFLYDTSHVMSGNWSPWQDIPIVEEPGQWQ